MTSFFAQGFLGTRGSFMLDLVCVAMAIILPALGASIFLVRRGKYVWHKRVQLTLGGILAVAVTLFEVDLRLVTDWQALAAPSPYFDPGGWNLVWSSLTVHLLCAVPTAVLWLVVLVRAVRGFSDPPLPGAHSRSHRRWAGPAAMGMVLTAVTGWIFYWLAFVAT